MKEGQGKRQCSHDYKVEVIERSIRRDILGLRPRQRTPKGIDIHEYFGISLDEARRSVGIRKRVRYPHFPLMERHWTRSDCRNYLKSRVPHEVPRSACVYCPFHTDAEWLAIKAVPEDWQLAVAVDRARRAEFAHRSLRRLEEVEFRHERQLNMFALECEGMCGV
jgi:hypothetical protein